MRIIQMFMAVIMLSSCSSQFAYRHLDWIILWYSDDYLELSSQQEAVFKQEISQLLQWHVQAELPKYRLQLQNLSAALEHLPLSNSFVEQQVKSVYDHWLRLREQIIEKISPLSTQLAPSQIDHLFHQLQERNQLRFEDHAQLNQEEILEERIERIETVLIEWLGSINTVQASLLYDFANQQLDTTQERLNYLTRYQAHLKQSMLPTVNATTLQDQLKHPDQFKSASYQAMQHSNQHNIITFIRNMSVHLQPQQVQHLKNKLNRYIDTIDTLLHAQ